jgi:twitching motility protein PilU
MHHTKRQGMGQNSQPVVVVDQDKATQYLYELALKLLELQGSDIFITAGSPPAFKVNQEIHRVSGQKLAPQQTSLLVRSIMNDR